MVKKNEGLEEEDVADKREGKREREIIQSKKKVKKKKKRTICSSTAPEKKCPQVGLLTC